MPDMNRRNEQEPETLEKFLVQEMEKRNLSITALARGAGISKQTIHAYLDGARPNLESCRKLAFFLGTSMEKIISLAYPRVEEKTIESLIKAYLELPDEGRRVAEDMIFSLQRHLGKR